MSHSDKPAETPSEHHDVAEIAPHEPDHGTDTLYTPPAKLKEYFTSPDAPSRYLISLSAIFALLALTCFGLLVFQYVKHRHLEQKSSETVVETVKVDQTYHQSLGEFKVQWDQQEMRASLTAECTTAAACNELQSKYAEVHDQLLPTFQESSAQNMLNVDSKQRVREQLIEQLNRMKLPGHIIQVDFTDLTIEPHKG